MSQLRRFSRPRMNSVQPLVEPSRFADMRGRLPYLLGGLVVLVLALAWIDGGEEPIRPIVQPIEASGAN